MTRRLLRAIRLGVFALAVLLAPIASAFAAC